MTVIKVPEKKSLQDEPIKIKTHFVTLEIPYFKSSFHVPISSVATLSPFDSFVTLVSQ